LTTIQCTFMQLNPHLAPFIDSSVPTAKPFHKIRMHSSSRDQVASPRMPTSTRVGRSISGSLTQLGLGKSQRPRFQAVESERTCASRLNTWKRQSPWLLPERGLYSSG